MINDGGPAFPRPTFYSPGGSYEDGYHNTPDDGMTLRDYFAAAAVQSVACGIIADANHGTTAGSLAAAAYGIADAMLAARAAHYEAAHA